MSINSVSRATDHEAINLGALAWGRRPEGFQQRLIEHHPYVRDLLGRVAVAMFTGHRLGLPQMTHFELRSGDPVDGGEDEALVGDHMFRGGQIVKTRHVLRTEKKVLDYDVDSDELIFAGDLAEYDFDDMVRCADIEHRYVLEADGDDADTPDDVLVDEPVDVTIFDALIEAAYQDGLVSNES